jgi:predicted dehydrogenase
VPDLRAAIIGFGLAGSVFHAPLLASTAGLSVASVVTRDPGRRERAEREHPGVRVFDEADELFAHGDEHDLVVVAAPNEAHVPLARRALDAGLPAVVDKPLAPSAADARGLVEHAEARGLLLTVFMNRRWDSDQLTLRRLIEEGSLGSVLSYESRFERWRPRLSEKEPWRERTPPEAGGGVLLDLGTHLVDQALALFGSVAHVYAEVAARRGGPADDDSFLVLQHHSGPRSLLWASTLAAAPGPRLRVLGDRAAYVLAGLDGQEDALRAGRRPGDPDDQWGVEPASRWGRLMAGDEEEAAPSEPGAWPRFYALLERALREGGPPPVDPWDAVRGLELLEAARRSAAEAAAVALPAG